MPKSINIKLRRITGRYTVLLALFIGILAIIGVFFLQKPGVFSKIVISPATNNSFYSAITRHIPGDRTFSLHADSIISNSLQSRSIGETTSRLRSNPINLPTPPLSGIYDVQWAYGFRKAPLIVSADPAKPRSRIAVLVPDYTWQAYNITGGKSLYSGNDVIVSLDRPIGEIFSKLFFKFHIRNLPIFDKREIRIHSPAFNPLEFISRNYGPPDVIAQSELVENYRRYNLSKYEMIVIYGHDEYWPKILSDEIANAISTGTGLLNISGNTSWWWSKVVDRTLQRTVQWYEADGEPAEESLLGVSFRFAGYPINRKFDSVTPQNILSQLRESGITVTANDEEILRRTDGFRILDSADQLFRGTGLSDGDWLGDGIGLNFGETDGWPLEPHTASSDVLTEQIKTNKLTPLAESWTVSARSGEWKVNHSAPIVRQNYGKGTVISLATNGWVRALLKKDVLVEKITSNAIDELLSNNLK